MKVAVVHDWLNGMRGGEYVLEAILELFPTADVYTLIYDRTAVSDLIARYPIRVSWLQYLPFGRARYRHFLPLMPFLIRRWDLSQYDLIVSSSHCVAKGVRKGTRPFHLSYIHAPMRYVWDRYEDYFGKDRAGWITRLFAKIFRPFLQRWDRWSSRPAQVDRLVANSGFIAESITRIYARESTVIHPFADLDRFRQPRSPGDFYLMVGAFAPNKRVDLAIAAFNQLGLKLRIVGDGPTGAELRAQAGENIQFLGSLSNEEIAVQLSQCKAFIFPGVEDFGITPIEAMAAGAPVLAIGAGGVLETVTTEAGAFFSPQTPEALVALVRRFESGELRFLEANIRQRAEIFSKSEFQRRLRAEICLGWQKSGRAGSVFGSSTNL